MMRSCYLPVFLFVLILFGGCHSSRQKTPDVSHIRMEAPIRRFDRQFMQADTGAVMRSLLKLGNEYPTFLPVYLERIMNFGPYPDTTGELAEHTAAFIKAKDIRQLQDTVNAHFPKLNKLQAELENGFRYIKFYLPEFKPPKVVTFISGLANYGAVTVDTVLGIGLDMFLGKNFVPYTKVANPYPEYMLFQFSPEFIAADCYKVLQQQMYPVRPGGTLLDQMIAYGKQLYFLDKVMPEADDYLKIGYTPAQIEWCRRNEQYIWQYFVQNDLLYIHQMQKIMHYIGPGPDTQGMPEGAPGNIGSWTGWQIVRKYMEENPETTMEGLMKMQDSQLLLTKAHYRPH